MKVRHLDGTWLTPDAELEVVEGETILITNGRKSKFGDYAGHIVKYSSAVDTPAIPIVVTSITGALQHRSDFSLTTCHELTDVVVAGTLDVPDRVFSLPIKRHDGRLYLFEASVIEGQFSVTINFPTSSPHSCTDTEVNKDLPEGTFHLEPMQFDVWRKGSV